MSSYYRAREIAWQLKDWISKGEFLLGKPSQLLPGPDKGEVKKMAPERIVLRFRRK